MNILSKVISTFLSKENKERVIKVLALGDKDIQEADQVAPFGIDSNPIKDMIAVYSDTLSNEDKIIIGYIAKDMISKVGELRLFSTNEKGEVQNQIFLKNDGNIELGGTADNLVRFQKLETALTNYNNLIKAELTKIQAGLSGVGGAYAKVDPTIDISASKITEIKTS